RGTPSTVAWGTSSGAATITTVATPAARGCSRCASSPHGRARTHTPAAPTSLATRGRRCPRARRHRAAIAIRRLRSPEVEPGVRGARRDPVLLRGGQGWLLLRVLLQ